MCRGYFWNHSLPISTKGYSLIVNMLSFGSARSTNVNVCDLLLSIKLRIALLYIYVIQNIFPLNLRFQSFCDDQPTHIDISQLKENDSSLSAYMWSVYVWSCYALKLTTELCEVGCRNSSWTEVVCLKAEILLQNLTSTLLLSCLEKSRNLRWNL